MSLLLLALTVEPQPESEVAGTPSASRQQAKIPVLNGTGIFCVCLPLVARMNLKANVQIVSAAGFGMINRIPGSGCGVVLVQVMP